MLNAIWSSFFLLAFLAACVQAVFLGNTAIFATVMQSGFEAAKLGFDIAIGLTGVMCLWLGVMRIGEQAGFTDTLGRWLAPLFSRLFPSVPAGHPALGAITMNMAANLLGLDNAATPMGLKAMQELQTLNPTPDTASDAQILFLVINASSITLLPITLFTYRAQLGAADPTDIFIPALLATYCSTLAGFLFVAWKQRLNLCDPVILAWVLGISAFVGGIALYFAQLSATAMAAQSAFLSNFLLFGLIVLFLLGAWRRKVDAYAAFIDGAKEGFHTAITVIPYLVAMLVGIAMLRSSGVLPACVEAARQLAVALGSDPRWIDGLPTMLMKPLSGSGARAMMIEAMQTHGADSFVGRLVCIIQGSSETTFYVLAVYFGSVGIQKMRYAISGGLLADLGGFTAAVLVAYWFFA